MPTLQLAQARTQEPPSAHLEKPEGTPGQIALVYARRADTENVFDELKKVVESGRQRVVKLTVKAEWWTVLKACYERLRMWLEVTAPQLEATGQILRRLARQTTEPPEEMRSQPALA